MNYQITYLRQDDCFIVKTTGQMKADDFLNMAKNLLNHSEFHPNSNTLFDHTSLDFDGILLEDLQRIREFHMKNDKEIGSGKSAMLFNPGSSHAWEKLWSQGEKINALNRVQLFEDYDEAFKWIKT